VSIEKLAGMQITGPISTVGEAREFLAAIEPYGVTDDTILDGYLEFRAAGTPTPVEGGATIVFDEEALT
jgi:hypothetical protein